jgi:hypothetical protein
MPQRIKISLRRAIIYSPDGKPVASRSFLP